MNFNFKSDFKCKTTNAHKQDYLVLPAGEEVMLGFSLVIFLIPPSATSPASPSPHHPTTIPIHVVVHVEGSVRHGGPVRVDPSGIVGCVPFVQDGVTGFPAALACVPTPLTTSTTKALKIL